MLLVDLLREAPAHYIALSNEKHGVPEPASKGYQARNQGSDPESSVTLQAQAALLVSVAADSAMGIAYLLPAPETTFAPWILARSVIESSATALWLLRAPSHAQGIARSYGLRFDALRQQLTIARDQKANDEEHALLARIEEVARVAEGRGVPVRRKDGVTTGFGDQVDLTKIVSTEINNGGLHYRLLSAVSHAQTWAIQQVGLTVTHRSEGVAHTETHTTPLNAAVLLWMPLDWFLEAAVAYFATMGWDSQTLMDQVNETRRRVVNDHRNDEWLSQVISNTRKPTM